MSLRKVLKLVIYDFNEITENYRDQGSVNDLIKDRKLENKLLLNNLLAFNAYSPYLIEVARSGTPSHSSQVLTIIAGLNFQNCNFLQLDDKLNPTIINNF